ncbi:MAG: DUF4279 domain-containing protein [Zavarzinia sp.]|nr:DUF4279 domain-containing protein [Zavarzinia sp.]
MSDADEPTTHYHFCISLRLWHPSIAPEEITRAIGIEPRHSWNVGEARRTPKGTMLAGSNRETYWCADVGAGRWPLEISAAIHDVLERLVRHRPFFHRIRAEDGRAELFIGWFFENQTGDTLTYPCLALAGDLQIDLSFDIYPPSHPQQERSVSMDVLPK